MTVEYPLRFSDLSFSYGNQNIIEDFKFDIKGQQWVAIVGVNGSGKSTFLKLILGLLKPQKGKVKIFEVEAGHFSVKSLMGSSLQEIDFPNSEKVHEVLRFVSLQYPNHHPLDDIISDFQLSDFIEKPCSQLSGGMRRRLSLACAFLGQSKIILLDEPSTGLDVDSRVRLLQNIKKYQQENEALVLMISHHPEEVVEYVDQFFHLKNGKIQTISIDTMSRSTKLRKVQFKCSHLPVLPPAIRVTSANINHEIIVESSDLFVKQMIANNIPFEDLLVSKIGAEELLGEIL